MAARVVDALPGGEDWLYEVKFDGYRALVIKNGDRVEIRSRNDKDLTSAYPGIAAAARKLDARQATVDGEVVAVDANGRPSFQALQHRSAHPGHTVVFYAFDLLHLNGRDLTGEPLDARRHLLPSVLDRSGILMSVDLPGDLRHVIAAVQSLGLEGVVAKRKSSRYTPGDRSASWLKLKLDKQQEFVVGGYRPGGGAVDSLLVGYYDGRQLRFAGKVRAGFTPRLRREVAAELRASPRRPMSVRRPAEQQGLTLGRRRHRRTDGGDAVAAAGAGRAGPLRRMDWGRPPASRGLPRPAK